MKLMFIGNMPCPFMLDLFGHIQKNNLAQVKCIFCCASYADRDWNTKLDSGFEVLRNVRPFERYPDLIVALGIQRKVEEFAPDIAIVGSHFIPAIHWAMHVLTRAKVPWLYWDENVVLPRNPIRLFLRRAAINHAVSNCSAILGIGKRAVSHLEQFSRGRRKLYNFPYVSDLSKFRVLQRTAPSENIRFFFSGQIIPRKGLDTLLKAFLKVASQHKHTTLEILGSGTSLEALKRSVPDEFKPRVTFHGFRQWEDYPSSYSLGDVFVFPSRYDGWALVVQDAMASGMPVITTNNVGSALDLVDNGVNGYLLNVDDVGAFTEKMLEFIKNPSLVRSMGDAARKSVRQMDVDQAAPRLVEILGQFV